MKTIFKSFLLVNFFLASFFVIAHADTKSLDNKLSVNFSIFNFGGKEEDEETGEIKAKPEGEVEEVVAEKVEMNSCEYYDSTSENILTLESASADVRQKIENVEETIDNESLFRETILSTVKDFFGLQKKDKVIFREMKKDISGAKAYYNDLDKQIEEKETFLDENVCENLLLKQAETVYLESEDMILDEETFRKQFAGSLKEKMKVLQDGLAEVKK